MKTQDIFKKKLEELRKSKGITQKDLAKDLRVSRTTIGYYESGERLPDIETAVRIADYFDITCDELIRGIKTENVDINKKLGLSDDAIFWLEKDIKPDESAIRPLNILLSEDYAKYLLKNIDEYCLYRLIDGRFKHICLKKFLAENKIELPEKEVEERSVRIFEVEKLWTDIREMWDKRIEFEHYLTEIELKYFGTLFTTDLDYHEYKVTKNFKDILDGLFFSYYDFSDLETNIDNYYGDLFSITEKVNISEFYYDLKRNNSEFLPTDYEKSSH